jgi:hypothetical protein
MSRYIRRGVGVRALRLREGVRGVRVLSWGQGWGEELI